MYDLSPLIDSNHFTYPGNVWHCLGDELHGCGAVDELCLGVEGQEDAGHTDLLDAAPEEVVGAGIGERGGPVKIEVDLITIMFILIICSTYPETKPRLQILITN